MISCYDSSTIDSLPWDKVSRGEETKNFLYPIVKNGTAHYIKNVSTDFRVLVIDDIALPITINYKKQSGSYVCSPTVHYLECAYEKVREVPRVLQWFIKVLLVPLKTLFKLGKIERIVFINNWLLPTNLYPNLTENQLKRIINYLQKHFPTHTVGFRSVDSFSNPNLLNSLKGLGCHLIGAREVFFIDGKQEDSFRSRMYKSDLKVTKKSSYTFSSTTSLSDDEASRILDLYNSLYLQKYTPHNPHFTLNFIHLITKQNLFKLWTLRNSLQIDGVYASFHLGQQLTAPIFGYDPSKPKEEGLYRQLSTYLAQEAKDTHSLFNQSTGAASFKLLRRAKPVVDYTAVYTRHLPRIRSLPWIFLKFLMNTLGIPIIKKYHL